MIKAKTPPKITVQYEGEETSVNLLELVGLVLASATISRVIFGVSLVTAVRQWWHYIW